MPGIENPDWLAEVRVCRIWQVVCPGTVIVFVFVLVDPMSTTKKMSFKSLQLCMLMGLFRVYWMLCSLKTCKVDSL